MADSDSWRDLAAQFLALPRPQGDIHARWQYTVGSGVVGNWTLGGDRSLRIQFEAIARRAAIGLLDKRSSDLLIAWLEAIRADGRGFEMSNSLPTEINDDGSRGATYCLGSIRGVCEASANFCRVLESLALQAEFDEKRRSDPSGVRIVVAQAVTNSRLDPKSLRDSYLAGFPDEQIKLLDLCWAAGQRYSEWKRWLRNAVKPDSSADRAFRAILASGKAPKVYRKQPRPKGWK
jgi:hypothetical protein